MKITQKRISEIIEWKFELYEERLTEKKYRQFQEEEYCRMTGAITAMLNFGIIKEDKYDELCNRATEIFNKTAIAG